MNRTRGQRLRLAHNTYRYALAEIEMNTQERTQNATLGVLKFVVQCTNQTAARALKAGKRIAGLAGVLLILAACATPPQLTREQWLDVTTRSYPDHTPAEILDAAREVFVLADGDDFTFAYPDDHSMVASRAWIVYAVLAGTSGVDVWHVSADENGVASVTLDAAVWPVRTQEVYDLFWARVDYMLGGSDHWPTCEGHGQMMWDKPSGIDAICSPWNIKDASPADPDWTWTTQG